MYKILRDISRLFLLCFLKLEVIGKEKIIEDGPIIFAANHISMLDPFMVGYAIKRDIRFLGKIELVRNPFIRPFMKMINLIPVDRSKNDIGALKNCIRALKNNEAIGIFPEGTRIKDGESSTNKAGVGFMAYKSGAAVQPITIKADYRIFSKVILVIHDPIVVPQKEKATTDDYEDFSSYVMNKVRGV